MRPGAYFAATAWSLMTRRIGEVAPTTPFPSSHPTDRYRTRASYWNLGPSRKWGEDTCGPAVPMFVAEERARPDRPWLLQQVWADRRTPQILIWGMGGAAAVLPKATAARRERARTSSHCLDGRPWCHQPLMFPIGRSSATFLVIPARSTVSTTSEIGL